MCIVELIMPVLVLLDNSNKLGQELVVASPPPPYSSIIVAGTGAAETSSRLYRLSDEGRLATSTVAATDEVTSSSEAALDASYRVWDLPNGRVEFENPFIFYGLTLRSSSGQILKSDHTSVLTSSISLWDPILLGR